MAKTTPATITYTPQGPRPNVTLSFHAVVSEAHTATSEITKFPVQTGFQVSNHKIRKNRVITIEGVITNLQLSTSKTLVNYSRTDNCKEVFEALESLVNTGTPCEVVTNLGIYEPVVFTKFSTKQSAGKVDSMHFTISGEELQVADVVNKAGPKVLVFQELESAEAEVRRETLKSLGIDVDPTAILSEASVVPGEDFVVGGINDLGIPTKTTFLNLGTDLTSGAVNYAMNVSDIGMYVPTLDRVLPEGGSFSDVNLKGGFDEIKDQFIGNLEDVASNVASAAENIALNVVATASGDLIKSAYGAAFNTIPMANTIAGQVIMNAGVDLLIGGLPDELEEKVDLSKESLPVTDSLLAGARKLGDIAAGVPAAINPITITRARIPV